MSQRTAVIVAAIVAAGLVAAYAWWPGDERAIQRRLDALASEFNESTTDGVGTLARAARLGSFFTADVTLDLGKGTSPITGREALMGMAARLQPRTSSFEVRFVDVTPTVAADGQTASVVLTVQFIRRSGAGADDSLDAREFSLEMVKSDGEWRIARATAVDPFK